MGNTHGEPREKSREGLYSQIAKTFISAGLSEEVALRLSSSSKDGSTYLASIKEMSIDEMKKNLGITEEDSQKLHSYLRSSDEFVMVDDEFVILEIAGMGEPGPLEAALLSSGAFEGKNPGEGKWNSLLKSRIFKADGDGCFDHMELDEETSLQIVVARIVEKK